MSTTKQDTEHHQCSLTGEPWDIVTKFIDSGIFVDIRRAFKRYTMINTRHPLTKSYAPSLYRLKEEEKVHLVEHYSMIHPFSMFSLHTNLIITLILLFYFATVPFMYPLIRDNRLMAILLIPMYGSHVVLIVVSFYTGYYDEERNIVTMEPGRVAKRYLASYFVFDVLLFLPIILKFIPNWNEWSDYYGFQIIFATRVIVRYVRYIWCLKVLKQIRLYFGLSTFTYKTIRLILNILLALGLSIYFLFVMLENVPLYDVEKFLAHSESTLQMLMMVNYGRDSRVEKLSGLLLPILFIICGFVFHLMILVETLDICFKYFSGEHQQTSIYTSINAYMKHKALPMTLRRRIYLYLEFKYQGHFFKESVIRRATSSYLRKEILLAATKDSIQRVDLFFKIPTSILREIGTILVSDIYLPGDAIIKAGNAGQCMFFLLAGTVLVTTIDDREICYLRDGAHFGEIALISNIARVANVTAVTPCELFKLDRKHFWEVVKNFPGVSRDVETAITERIASNSRIASSLSTVAISEGNPQIKVNVLLKIPPEEISPNYTGYCKQRTFEDPIANIGIKLIMPNS